MNSDRFLLKLGELMATKPKDKMIMITLYEKPADCPDGYVARVFLTETPTSLMLTAPTAEELHQVIPDRHFVWTARHSTDEPQILGTYL